jgi:UDP-N-acetylglucosamine:LPS N-acetylglucosamine transferase
MKKVLAIASSGGHWVELRRLRPAWSGCNVVYVTTSDVRHEETLQDEPAPAFYSVVEASRWEKVKLVKQLLQIAAILLKERPQVIISTGAAPGYFALRIGKLLGAKTVWVDSIANAEELSLSGRKVCSYADLWLTQWEHLAQESIYKKELAYRGAVL